jgi:hypothetical protein
MSCVRSGSDPLTRVLTMFFRLPTLNIPKHTSKASLSSILYYITGHGYGHSVRSNQVIRRLLELDSGLKIHVRTTAPDSLFHNPLAPVTYSRRSTDVGIVQRDSLEMDVGETLKACQALHDRVPQTIEEETTFVRQNQIDLVIGDIPPLCFEIAARVKIPSVAIANFTWSFIYRAYIEEHPGFMPLIDEMESYYRKAALALALPYACGMDVFPKPEPIPWIARTSCLTKKEARVKFALSDSAIIVLLSFGGLGLKRVPWERLKQRGEFFFVATGKANIQEDNISVLPGVQRQYEDLVRAVDVVVTKPGYGIVADALAHRVPVLYTDRGDFPEYPFLAQALSDLANAEYIPQEEMLSGNIGAYLHAVLSKQADRPSVPLTGATIAAERILALL